MKRAAWRLALLSVSLATLWVPQLHAQSGPACTEKDTPLSCWLKFNPVLPDEIKAEAKAKQTVNAGAAVKTANTGATTLTSTTATALKDFLSLFAASVDSATVSEKGNAVTLDWNLPFPIVDPAERSLKLQAVFTKPEISDAVSSALGSNAAGVKKLNDSLSNTDDIAASLTYSPVNERFGRSITPHLKLFRAIQDAIDQSQKDAKDKALRAALEVSDKIIDENTPFTAIEKAKQGAAIAAMQAAAQAAQATLKQTDSLVRNFACLLNNQPQVYGSVLYHERKDLVGPNTVSGKFTYEIGSANLNRFRALDNHQCDVAAIAKTAAACLTKLNDFVKNNGGTDVDSSDRLALSLEYQQSRANRVDLPSEFSVAAPVVSPHTHSLVYSATYGRSVTAAAGRDGRLDIAASYENVSNDPTKNDRFVGSITYTQKITDTMSLPLALIYANHSQFLSNVNRKLNVHFGLSYKLPDLKAATNQNQ